MEVLQAKEMSTHAGLTFPHREICSSSMVHAGHIKISALCFDNFPLLSLFIFLKTLYILNNSVTLTLKCGCQMKRIQVTDTGIGFVISLLYVYLFN